MNNSINVNARRFFAIAGAAAALFAAQPALADTATANINVTATVTKNCTITASPIAFGNVDVTTGAADDAAGGLSITCTSGTPYTLTGPGATGARNMLNGTKTLAYTMYSNSARTTAWVDGTAGTGTGSVQSIPIYGRITANQTGVSAGAYTDTVVVTLTY